MSRPVHLTAAEYGRIAAAVARAEQASAGEIVTVVADRSDGYADLALVGAALVALAALSALAVAPDFALGAIERASGGWNQHWTAAGLFALATVVAAATFAGAVLLQRIPALRFRLVPGPVKAGRVHARALAAFRIAVERRTADHTGVLIYVSMRERRAEVLADVGIASKVEGGVWVDALDALLAEVRRGDVAAGMCAAVERVGAVLAIHAPRRADDRNELLDRAIEI